jgi:hypothetical protein
MIGWALPSGKLRVQSETRAAVAGAPHLPLRRSAKIYRRRADLGLGAREDFPLGRGPIGQGGTPAPMRQRRRFANLGQLKAPRRRPVRGQPPLPPALFGQGSTQNAGQPKIGRGQARKFLFGGGNGRLELGPAVLRR